MADEMAEETNKVIESLKAMEAIEDPVARAAAISDVLKYVEKRAQPWRDIRSQVVRDLRAKKTPYRKIAAMIRTSLGTVQALERGHAGAWGTKPRTKPDINEEQSDGS